MEFIKATASGECFTVGKLYPILDGNFTAGILTADNNNENHHLSPEYLSENFTALSSERNLVIDKSGKVPQVEYTQYSSMLIGGKARRKKCITLRELEKLEKLIQNNDEYGIDYFLYCL